MTDSEEGADFSQWCDYCQRGKTGYPSLPDDMGVTDLDGELICDECNTPTITAVAQYECPDDLVWKYYRDEEPPIIESIQGEKVRELDEHTFEESVDVPTATNIIEKQTEEDTVTLVPPFSD